MKINSILFWLSSIAVIILLILPRIFNINIEIADKLTLILSLFFLIELVLSSSKHKNPNIEQIFFLSFIGYIFPHYTKWAILLQLILVYFIFTKTKRETPKTALFFTIILIYFMALNPYANIDYRLIIFLASLFIFLLYKIDPRFFILGALLHFILAAILNSFDKQAFAETQAIYTFYYLVVGVIGLMIQKESKYEIEGVINRVNKKIAIFSLITLFGLFIPNILVKTTSIFIPVSVFFLLFVKQILKDDKKEPAS